MARLFKEDEFNAKRNEILDYALSLVYTKGYERMTIQDILDGLQISRGALYHYFDSKQTLLEALIDRVGKAAEQTILTIVENPNLTALEKFHRYFDASARWKNEQKSFLLSVLPMWFSDENAFLRQKMSIAMLKHTAPLLAPMIRQGVEEQVFTTRYPEQAAVIITGIYLSFTDTLVEHLLRPEPGKATVEAFGTIFDAYMDAIERILGAPEGTLKVFKADDFADWFAALKPEAQAR